MNEKTLTRRERQIMDLIYAEANLTVSDVNERLGEGATYPSTRAALSRLVEKKQLQFDKRGARYLYRPMLDTKSAGKNAVQRVMDTFFGGSPVATIDALLGFSNKKLSTDEIKQLQQMLDSAKLDRKNNNRK